MKKVMSLGHRMIFDYLVDNDGLHERIVSIDSYILFKEKYLFCVGFLNIDLILFELLLRNPGELLNKNSQFTFFNSR